MPKFDELFDDVILKAKVAADVASKKTGEVVELGKLKYQAKQISWEIEKTYSKLGAIVYESKRSNENFEDLIALAVGELDTLNSRLDETEEKIASFKKSSKSTSSAWTPAADAAKASVDAAAEAVGAAAEAAKAPAEEAFKSAAEAVRAAAEAVKAPAEAAAETVGEVVDTVADAVEDTAPVSEDEKNL